VKSFPPNGSGSRQASGGGQLSRGKKALFLAVIYLVFAAVLEIGARVYSPQPMLPYIPSADARVIYELNPHWPEFNSLGMRQAEIAPAMLKDHFVIAAIGDSHTFGIGSTERERAFPMRLQHYLARLTAQPITVLNFGVPGYNMAQELEVLRAKALPLRPDLVVLQYTVNDEHISNWIQPRFPTLNRAIHRSVFLTSTWKRLLYSPRTQTPLFGPPRRQTKLLAFVERYLPDLLLDSPGLVGTPISRERDPVHGRPHPPRVREQVPPRYWDFIGRNNLERDVRTFGEVNRMAGIPMLATGFIEDHDKSLYESAGFQVYSFFEIFKGADMREYGYDPANTAGHFTDEGSNFIAEHLADYIKAHFDLTIR
jgi:lysophospholipase L1-like esterase